MPISVVINTRNEEVNIEDCIRSAKLLTDKIIVIDMESGDRTVEIASKSGATVFGFPFSRYVEPARGYGIEKSKTDWLLILDADERVTEQLAGEIIKSIGILKYSYYKLPRKNIFGKSKWLRHGGWWPDHQTRLINKKFFMNWPKRIHSTPAIKGEAGYLENPIVHYFHGDLHGMVEKTIVFEGIESDLLHKAGRKATVLTFFRKYFAELFRRLFKGLGFMDGTVGIIESVYQAYSKTITYLYLYEKSRTL